VGVANAHDAMLDDRSMRIASHAVTLGLTLVTNNTKEFCRVADLQMANWAERPA
jgi:predicted nucleic acid-binding protein